MSWQSLSIEAESALEEAAGRRRSARRAWERGPYVDVGKVFIPSEFYSGSASTIYRRLGMRFDSIGQYWYRDVSLPYRGKVYSAEAWLKAARKAYKMVWPKWEPPSEGE